VNEPLPGKTPRYTGIRDQYKAMKKLCDELGLHFGRFEEDAKAVLAEKGVTNPT